jgi:YbbR domain-containing protein
LPSTPSGNINIDVLANTVYYFNSNTTANVTFNLRGNSNTRLDAAMSNGDSISVAIALRHANPTGGRHVANVAIDGG